MAFDPKKHLRKIKSGKSEQDYLDVKWRLVWFREHCPQGTIDTEELAYDLDREVEAEINQWNDQARRYEKVTRRAQGYARYRAVVTDGQGGRATGTKSENAANFADFGEKAETGAIGRALAALGYGTQFTGDELDEEHRIVDAPVDRQPGPAQQNGNGQADESPATAQQLASIEKLAERIGRKIEQPATYGEAKARIEQLSHEYNEAKRSKK